MRQALYHGMERPLLSKLEASGFVLPSQLPCNRGGTRGMLFSYHKSPNGPSAQLPWVHNTRVIYFLEYPEIPHIDPFFSIYPFTQAPLHSFSRLTNRLEHSCTQDTSESSLMELGSLLRSKTTLNTGPLSKDHVGQALCQKSHYREQNKFSPCLSNQLSKPWLVSSRDSQQHT